MILRPPELVNLAGTDTGRDHLSHTSIGTLLACPRRFALHYERRLSPRVTPVALSMGRAFAESLEHVDPEHGYRLLLDEHQQLSLARAGDPWVTVPDREQALIQATTVRAASRAYLERYGARQQMREVDVRVRLRNPRTGRPSRTFDLVGRLDAVSDDFRTIIEDKLVSRIPRGEDADRLLRIDRQISIGCYLVWRTTGILVEQVRYRWTLKPQIRQRKGESLDDYLARIEADYQERPDHYLVEEVATRSLEDLAELEQELWRWAEMVRDARADGVWPRNVAHCQAFGGCHFLPLCAGEPGAEHQFHVRERRDDARPDDVVRGSEHEEAA